MRSPWPVWLSFLATAALTLTVSAQPEEAWTSTRLYDAVEDVRVRIASVRGTAGHQLKVHAPSHEDQIWATFLLPPDSPAPLDIGQGFSWTLEDGRRYALGAVTAAVGTACGEPAAALQHSGPRYLTFAIAAVSELGAPDSPLAALAAAQGELQVRYGLENGQHELIRFSLAGADTALAEVTALFTEADR
jgi:hypothetical protein